MKPSTWQKIETLFLEFPMMKANSIHESEIQNAEKILGASFNEDYRKFIKKYGGAILGAHPIYGLKHASPMDRHLWSVVDVTEKYRKDNWYGIEDWYIISTDHSDNPIGINKHGEVYISDHDFGVVDKIAESFEEYILKCLDGEKK